jgi:hypothetical protein
VSDPQACLLYTILYREAAEREKAAHREHNGFNKLRRLNAAHGSDSDPRLQLITQLMRFN